MFKLLFLNFHSYSVHFFYNNIYNIRISISWHERELYHTPTLSSLAPHRYPTSEFLPCFPTNTLNLRVYFLLYYCSYKYTYLCRNIQTHSLGQFLLFIYIYFFREGHFASDLLWEAPNWESLILPPGWDSKKFCLFYLLPLILLLVRSCLNR